jgi:predicted nucleic acid-binding protein
MILYAESSAILAWLLGEPSQSLVLAELRSATRVVSSSLTGVECARGLARAHALGRISAADELAGLRLLDVAESSWDVHDLSELVTRKARSRFPLEPIRTLDALHIATAQVFSEALGELAVLTFDARVRHNALALGMKIVPAD